MRDFRPAPAANNLRMFLRPARIRSGHPELLALCGYYGHIGAERVREIQLKDAKAKLSAVVDDASRGEEFVITRHGRKEAVVVSWHTWRKLSNVPSFGRLLAAAPLEDGDLPPRDETPLRDAGL
jgi:antitoxin Phd